MKAGRMKGTKARRTNGCKGRLSNHDCGFFGRVVVGSPLLSMMAKGDLNPPFLFCGTHISL